MHYSQSDYIMALEGDVRCLQKVGFCWPWYHNSDHRVIIATIQQGMKGQLNSYQKQRQQFPLQLPAGPHDELTTAFKNLKVECINPAAKQHNCKDWVSDATWQLIKQRMSLLQARQLRCNKASKCNRRSIRRSAWTGTCGQSQLERLSLTSWQGATFKRISAT